MGRDLLVSVAAAPRGQRGHHLGDEIRTAIRAGALRPGVRLPSSRALSDDLGISRGVVTLVYEQLTAEGYLVAVRGSGTRVAAGVSLRERRPSPAPSTSGSQPASALTFRPASPGMPDLGLFPRRDWLKAYRAAVERLPVGELRYPEPRGYEPLRAELADYLGRVRGVRAAPDQILVVNGFAQALAVLARILPSRGIDTVAVEEPGSIGTRGMLRNWDIETPPIAVDADGLEVAALERSDADAVLVTPAHHYPTGVVLSPERRRQLLRWAGAMPGRYVIEDDYDAEFRYDQAPVGSLQALDPDRVITGSSVSKTLAPGLRLGWVVLPVDLVADAVAAKASFDLGVPVLSQAALAGLLASGAFDSHLRRCRLHYRRKRHSIADRLASALPEAGITGLDAGLTICVRLDGIEDDVALAAELDAAGIRCEALSSYHQLAEAQRGLVIDLVALVEPDVDLLAATVRSFLSPGRPPGG